ncbi:Glycine betaine-binding periplasmic protein precursor [Kluyvera cryocrescens]|uniref:Glycine betaine-binding periplasmic protein n=1 Tax=Kluyvera cryocrescens TaxID=580 RepID=A0A485B4Y6_KLUCR|nr:Glycine betaine-binding periplasmic protein precursor [Kluyvera cryocrescens]
MSDVLKPGKDVVWLQVPFSSLPGVQKNIDTKLSNGANYGFPVSTMHIVANKAWAEKNPAAAKLFCHHEAATVRHQRPERDDA